MSIHYTNQLKTDNHIFQDDANLAWIPDFRCF